MNADGKFPVLKLCCLIGVWLPGLLLNGQTLAKSPRVDLVRTPNGGIQPQTMVDAKGVVHLIYFKGDPQGGDIFYVRQEPGKESFSNPLRVNNRSGSAMAVGTIRGAQLAAGKDGRVHVAWDGMGKGAAPATINGKEVTPLLYTRLNDTGTGFDPERNLITYAAGLDGGSSVAADDQGNVYVMWHASKPGNTNGEAGRAVFVARSADDGKTFARETPATQKPTGACGCCGMKAFADSLGNVFALYRAAAEKVNRDEILLVSRDRGASFEIANAHPWTIPTCPMSSASLSETKAVTLAAWETEAQVYFASVNPKTLLVSKAIAPPGTGKRKHPVAVGNAQGEVLLVWTDGTGWQRGGAVAWQLFDARGRLTAEKGRAEGVPVWSLVAAVPRPDGGFVIFY